MASIVNATNNASFIPTIVAQKALGRLASYMNLAKTVSRDFDFATASYGQVIKVPKRGSLSANAKTTGTAVTLQTPTATDTSVTLDQHFEVSFQIADVTKLFSNQDTMEGYATDAAIALAEKIETYIAGLHTSIANTITWDRTSTATKVSSLLKLRQRMVANNIPRLETKYLYVDPTVMNDLLSESQFTTAQNMGSAQNQIEGNMGATQSLKLYGFEIFESQNVQTTSSPVCYHNLAYTRDAFCMAFRPLPTDGNGIGAQQVVVNNPDVGVGLRTTMSYDPNQLGVQLTLDVLFGASLLDTRRVVELESF